MAFREVGVHEVREVLRLWLRGEGRECQIDFGRMRLVFDPQAAAGSC